ncbi:hypothetical protein [Hydrocoleum sp. CS-953]|uniref:hypothetical protein n=1 Tax=Hydrocoleum sp. CS-953 TaxID=1671698 RepID=UPI00143DA267|nr:hypothetical protein [Hydrocoleum sp. CS-953]
MATAFGTKSPLQGFGYDDVVDPEKLCMLKKEVISGASLGKKITSLLPYSPTP